MGEISKTYLKCFQKGALHHQWKNGNYSLWHHKTYDVVENIATIAKSDNLHTDKLLGCNEAQLNLTIAQNSPPAM